VTWPTTRYPLQFGLDNLVTGQQAVTGTAAALADQPALVVILKALKANSISVFYGPAGVSITTGNELAPGESHLVSVSNLKLISVIAATTGVSVCWTALY